MGDASFWKSDLTPAPLQLFEGEYLHSTAGLFHEFYSAFLIFAKCMSLYQTLLVFFV